MLGRRALAVFALLAAVSCLGSWIAQELPPSSPALEIAGMAAPGSAEALPPAPGGCSGPFNAVYYQASNLEYSMCRNQFGCHSGSADACIEDGPDPEGCGSESCVTCAEGAVAKGWSSALNYWDQYCGGQTYCSHDNPWC